jgi:hypothetical protein
MKRRKFIALIGGAAQDSRILQRVSPLLVAFSSVLLTTVVLLAVDSFLDAEALVFLYLLPMVVMAMHYGSTVAVLTNSLHLPRRYLDTRRRKHRGARQHLLPKQ